MIKDFYSTKGLPVFPFHGHEPIAFVQDVIINPDTGKLEALWVRPMLLPIAFGILDFNDIVEWKRNLYVRSENVIAEPGEIIRINAILDRNISFMKNNVVSESGEALGKVVNLDFDSRDGILRHLYVQKGFLGFSWERRVFDFASILEVTPEAIIVKDLELKSAEERARQFEMDEAA
jgi:sporulation protein YlmC with PRC-barrel domain